MSVIKITWYGCVISQTNNGIDGILRKRLTHCHREDRHHNEFNTDFAREESTIKFRKCCIVVWNYVTVGYCSVLCCAVLYCAVLYCTVLCCTVLYCTVLYCTVLYCNVLYCTVLYCTVLYCTALGRCYQLLLKWSVIWTLLKRRKKVCWIKMFCISSLTRVSHQRNSIQCTTAGVMFYATH